MHRRLQWLRAVDEYVRYRVRRVFGLAYRRPLYLTPQRTPEQEMRRLLTVEAFVGRHSPDPRLVRYYVADEAKQRLMAEGPRCSLKDEAHVLSLCDTGDYLLGDPEARAVLGRVKQDAETAMARLAGCVATDAAMSAATHPV